MLSAAIFIISHAAVLANPTNEAVDGYVHKEMTNRRIPGLALAVIRNGKLEKIASYGFASVEFGVKATPDTLFHIASITKSFTSTAIMSLVEAGKIHLNDDIGKYIEGLPDDWNVVTVKQLLNHTSGLPDIALDQYSEETIADTQMDALFTLRQRPMDFRPGDEYRYNQTNYMLLGMIIEKVAGFPFAQFLSEKMFYPLKMGTATFGDVRKVVRNRSTIYTSYRFGGERPSTIDRVEVLNYKAAPIIDPAGGLNMSVRDFAAWIVALMNGKIVQKNSLKELWSATTLNGGAEFERPPSRSLWRKYGLGWVLNADSPHPFVGGTGGLRAAFFIYPNDSLAIVVLTNLQGSGPESLVDGIAQYYF